MNSDPRNPLPIFGIFGIELVHGWFPRIGDGQTLVAPEIIKHLAQTGIFPLIWVQWVRPESFTLACAGHCELPTEVRPKFGPSRRINIGLQQFLAKACGICPWATAKFRILYIQDHIQPVCFELVGMNMVCI